jgi:hypothetical protein
LATVVASESKFLSGEFGRSRASFAAALVVAAAAQADWAMELAGRA